MSMRYEGTDDIANFLHHEVDRVMPVLVVVNSLDTFVKNTTGYVADWVSWNQDNQADLADAHRAEMKRAFDELADFMRRSGMPPKMEIRARLKGAAHAAIDDFLAHVKVAEAS